MNYLIAVCLAYMVILCVIAMCKIFTKDRQKRLGFLKEFKKGLATLIYFAAIPLYWIGIAYSGKAIGASLLMAIKNSIGLVVLKYEYDMVALLMANNIFYRITLDICFVLVAINAILFGVTVLGNRVANKIKLFRFSRLSKKVYVVIGFDEQNKAILDSIVRQNGKAIVFAEKGDELVNYAYAQKIAYKNFSSESDLGAKCAQLFKRFDNKLVDVIINSKDDARNLIYTKQLSTLIRSLPTEKYLPDDNHGLNGYVFGEPENQTSFLHFVKETSGRIHYINKYHLIAMDFVGKFPITEFMDERQIDYSTATIKDETSINVLMIGFGKTNQKVFLTSVANNQLLTYRDGKLAEKAINYWIYDKKHAQNDKNLNHNYFRYSSEFLYKDKEYLPLPAKPAQEKFFEIDINDMAFYSSIKENLSSHNSDNVYNYIVVAYGTDMENIDFSQKLEEKLKEWELIEKTRVFVKIRDKKLAAEVTNDSFFKSEVEIFGIENDVVYNISQIVAEQKESMAKDRHLCYAIKSGMTFESEKAARLAAIESWYGQEQVRRESNIYACLSIRMKLHLLGFDCVKIDEKGNSAEKEYMDAYQVGDIIKYDTTMQPIKGRKVIEYSNDLPRYTKRYTMAAQEHQRWNAYMITCGFIPEPIENIKKGKVKDFAIRRHGNITTFEGLVKFREIYAKAENISEENADVIRYDYQLMDDLVWLLGKNGYKIVKRNQTVNI